MPKFDTIVQVWKKVQCFDSPVRKVMTVSICKTASFKNASAAETAARKLAAEVKGKYSKDTDFLEVKHYSFATTDLKY